jgi:hypothetical protein
VFVFFVGREGSVICLESRKEDLVGYLSGADLIDQKGKKKGIDPAPTAIGPARLSTEVVWPPARQRPRSIAVLRRPASLGDSARDPANFSLLGRPTLSGSSARASHTGSLAIAPPPPGIA